MDYVGNNWQVMNTERKETNDDGICWCVSVQKRTLFPTRAKEWKTDVSNTNTSRNFEIQPEIVVSDQVCLYPILSPLPPFHVFHISLL